MPGATVKVLLYVRPQVASGLSCSCGRPFADPDKALSKRPVSASLPQLIQLWVEDTETGCSEGGPQLPVPPKVCDTVLLYVPFQTISGGTESSPERGKQHVCVWCPLLPLKSGFSSLPSGSPIHLHEG